MMFHNSYGLKVTMYIVIEGTCSLGSIQPEETLFRLLFFPLSSNAFSPLFFFSVHPGRKVTPFVVVALCASSVVINTTHEQNGWGVSIHDQNTHTSSLFQLSLLCRWRCQSFNANEKNMPMNSNDFTYEEVSLGLIINDNHKQKAQTNS